MSSELHNKWNKLTQDIKRWGTELGFQQVGIANIDLEKHKIALQSWLDNGFHGEMGFMSQNIDKRLNPAELHPATLRVISVRLNYLPDDAQFASNLKDKQRAYVSRYATGRDYHKIMRGKLKKLGEKISTVVPEAKWRPFSDSAPVLEHALAENAGIGWTGKHSLTLNEEAGSWFFLGELFINLPLKTDTPVKEKCGQCIACIKICPTQAIVAPYVVDAKRCISYLTIENKADIPEEFRTAIGNRIYGCDDCQLICPWNRFANITQESDFTVRNNLTQATLLDLFNWDEKTFLDKMQGSAIRRIGHQSWLRNIAVALGNSDYDADIVAALKEKKAEVNDMVNRHIDWALNNHELKKQKQDANQLESERLTLRLIRSVEKGLPRDA